MSKQITFKRNHIDWAVLIILIIAFSAIITLAYRVFVYTPEIVNEPFEYPKEETR